MDVLVITRAYPTAADPVRGAAVEASVTAWRARGHTVQVFPWDGVSAEQAKALAALLSDRAFDRLAIFGFDERVAHVLDRGWRCQATPLTVFCGHDSLFAETTEFALPYFTRPVPMPRDDARRRAYERLAADPRVDWVFRSRWHHARTERLLGLPFQRSSVIPAAVSADFRFVEKPTGAQTRLVFFGRFIDERRHAVDVFVQTILALSKRSGFDRLDVLVVGDGLKQEELLAPLSHLRNVRAVRKNAGPAELAELLRDRGIAVLPGRAQLQGLRACQAAAAGLAVVTSATGGTAEFLPNHWGSLVDGDDPVAWADAVEALVKDPERCAQAARGLSSHAAKSCAAELITERELKVLSATPPRLPTRASATPELTVTVPAYNAGHQLSRCVESLVRLAPPGSLEVVIVDDGSTDATPTIAAELAARWPDVVRVIGQENRGHGGAVNTGLREARGRYFRVVDADDWVDSFAFAAELKALPGETTDLLLTDYAEVTDDAATPRTVDLFGRLTVGATCWFDTLTDPHYGLTSWGPILSTSTFRTDLLRKAGFSLSERSAYVDMEYCTLGLQHVETLKYLGLDVYRYSLGAAGQSVSQDSYRKRYKQHEAVVLRLCDFVRDVPLADAKRRYVIERVLLPLIGAHLNVLRDVLRAPAEERAFRRTLARYAFLEGLELPGQRRGNVASLARRALKALLPPAFVGQLDDEARRSPQAFAAYVARYFLPAGVARFFGRDQPGDR
ncbi:MAG: glycosyltransferase [Myxococcota bacterium]